ncbi:MAG: IS110 family transposase, partial [Desulfobacula sp.]|nr:IS110 family transposase [Desulfobacula sp.]
VAFAGLDPVTNQSGYFKNSTGPISKRGSPQLRSALFMAANTLLTVNLYNSILLQFFSFCIRAF